MVQNLPEDFIFDRLPAARISEDEKGLLEAVCGGWQDRLSDLRSYASKLSAFYTPGALPDPVNNAILVTVQSGQGVFYVHSLDIQGDTPASNGPALTLWASQQLNLPPSAISNAQYGQDPLRLVNASVLSLLAATVGCVLYQSIILSANPAAQTAANVALVQTWFPRLQIKGTAQSFEVLGRLLGFDDVRFTPLWTRLSPRMPQDVGNPVNDADFAATSEYPPQQVTGPYYNPFCYRDGPFFSWTTTVDSGTNSNNFYSQVINGFNPWVNVVLLGSLAGTNVPSIANGTVVHPLSGTYYLGGGLPNFNATVSPSGSSIQFEAVAEGDSFNGLAIVTSTPGTLYNATGTAVAISGSLCTISISDRLSAVKYRSSYFDIGLTSSMDDLEEIFGSRAVTTNADLQANPALTSDGTAVSPYWPWVGGSIAVEQTTSDWITSSGSNVSTFETRVEANPSAPLSSRQLNIDSVLAAGVQVIEAFEEVRPATRQPRQSQFGFLWDDQVPYAAYVSFATLFTTTADVGVYNGSYSDTPSTVYPATVAFAVSGSQNFICSPETDPNEDTFYYGTQDGGLTLFGTYSLDTGSYWFNFYGGAVPAGITVTASWVAFTTEVIRDEPSRAEKSVGSGEGNAFPVYSGDTNIQARPEDLDDSTLVLEVSDDVGWRRDIVAGGELNDLTIYQAGTELGIDVLTPQTVFRDQTGVDLNVFGVVSQYPPMRVITQVRLTDATYQPGNLAVGYQGVFRDTSQISSNDTSIIKLPVGATVGDTDTDYDTLFEPGYGLFHVGIAQGVMVADLPGFFGTHHRDNLAAWFALNEHPDDDLAPVDHSVYAGSLVPTGIDYSNRSYDSERGWSLGMAQASLNSVAARGIGQEVTASFWIRVTAPPVAQETIVQAGPTEFACDGTHIYAYLQDSNNNPQLVGSALLTAASLTLGGTTNFSNGDTVMVGGVTYTFQSILVNVPNNVLIASSLSFSLLNLKAAIAATLGAGITYGDGTAVNPLVTASHLGATLTMTVRASAAAIGTAFTLVSAVGGFTLQPSGEPSFSVASGTAYPFPVGWQFVYIRAASGTAFANFSTLSVFGTEVSLADPLIPASALNAVSVNAAVAEYNIHDLRVWNTCKTEADMDLVRYHDPTPTICTYPLGYIYTVDRQDRYGILVLPSGWAVAGGLPSWHRQSWQGLVRRYDSMGSYFGEDRFKETGIGEGRPLPATYLLGSQFTTLTSAGTATFSTTSGYLPGDNPLWEDLSNASGSYAPGTYASIAYDAGAVAAGTGFPVAYVNSGTESPWPSAMVQTNVFREAIWASDGPGQTMYEVTLDGSGTYAYLVFQPVARGRTAGEIAVSPVFGPLVQNGTFSAVIDAMPVSGVITGGTGTLYYPSGSQAFNVSDLYVSDQPTGPYTVNMAQLTATEPYNGISALTSFYMYLNSSINVEVPNAFDTWTDQGNTAQDNGVDYSANPQIVYSTGSGVYLNTPVLGVDGVLEFQNSSPLPAGNYVLTVVSGQVGQPDADLTGFDVTLTLNSTVLDLVLLNGQFNGGNGFNLTGTNVFPIQVTDAVSGNWLLSLDWTNALADQDTGTQRQLAIYSYSLRQLFTKPYQVQVGPLASPCAPIITLLDIGTVPGTVPGGWFAVLNSYGTASGYAHESAIYPSSDTVANTSPLSNILTSLTNERREDVIYTGTDVFISDAGSYAFPTFYGGTVAVAPGGLLQAGETGTFSVSGYGSLSDIYSYAWRFWDSTGTATPGPTVMKVINTGSNPMGAPAGLQLSCMPVGVDGQSTVLYGTLAANNGPIILAGGASISVNDAYFPYATQMGLTVFSFENLPLSFAWYAGATFLGSGVSSSAGLVAGTWSGNGTVEIGQFNGVQNYFDAVIGSPTEVTGVVTDASGGTASFDFSLRGQLPPPAAASAGASAIGLVASVSDVQRIGAGQSVDFTVYANSVTGGTLSFSWEFYGSHNWTVTGQSSGTTSILPNGGYQNTVSKDISGEVVAAGTQKTVEAVCDIFLTNLATQTTQMSQVTVDMVLLTNLPPSPMTISVSDNGVPIVNGIGTLGDVIEFDATGTDPNHDWVWYAWNFNQPFTPNVGLYWGPKVRLDTSRYTEGQAVSGVVTATDLLGSQFTFILPDILLFSS